MTTTITSANAFTIEQFLHFYRLQNLEILSVKKKFILLAKGRGAVKTLVVSHKDCLAE